MYNNLNSNKVSKKNPNNLFPGNRHAEIEDFKSTTSASLENNSPDKIIEYLNTTGYPSTIIKKIIKNFSYNPIIKAYTYYSRKNIISKILVQSKKKHSSPQAKLNEKINFFITTMSKKNLDLNKLSLKNSEYLNLQDNNLKNNNNIIKNNVDCCTYMFSFVMRLVYTYTACYGIQWYSIQPDLDSIHLSDSFVL